MTRRQGRHGKNFNRATVTMKPGSAVGPRSPLSPRGVAAGPQPNVTGVQGIGDDSVAILGTNLDKVQLYNDGELVGPYVEVGTMKAKAGYVTGNNWLPGQMVSKSPNKIIVKFVPMYGKLEIKAIAHSDDNSRGKIISVSGLPAFADFGGASKAAASSPKPTRPTRRRRRRR